MRREQIWVGVLFAASGFSALVYQVTWQRILALHTGVGVYSVAMIVASFLAGLGVGSHLGGIWSARLDRCRALRVFALLELAIGLFAAASCTLFYDLLYLKAAWLYTPAWRAGLSHFLALLFPTTLMGMSLPFMVRARVEDAASASRTIGTLYGLNVAGASVGALFAPWLLIRYFGICGAVWCGVASNVLVGLGALALPKKVEATGASGTDTRSSVGPERPLRFWILLYSLSGFCALALEIVWFRIIDVAVRSTAFTFGSVLFIFLLGLSAGAWIGARRVSRFRDPLRAFLLCQCVLLAYSALAVIVLASLPTGLPGYRWYFEYWVDGAFVLGGDWNLGAILRLYVLLPAALYGLPTVLMGFSFALLQRAVQDDPRTSGRKVGVLQAVNIAGNVAGSLAVGLLSLALWGTTGTLRALLLGGLVFALVGIRNFGARSLFSLAGVVLLGLALALPDSTSLWSRLHGLTGGPALIEEDATSVVALKPEGSGWRVLVNGHRHSWLPFGGIHSWLGALPALMHPAPRRVAVIGLGSGDTAWAAASREETEAVSVFEIASPQVRLLKRYAEFAADPRLDHFLADPRVRVSAADGRVALFTDEKLYDVIVVDALRPTSAYGGNLYSFEFFARCARKLKPGGLMSSWVPTPRVSATFRRAFPHTVNVRNGEILVGSINPIEMDRRAWQGRLSAPSVRDYLGPRLTDEIEECIASVKPTFHRDSPESEINRDLFPRDEFLRPR